MATEDLTLREVEEAGQYGLAPDQYEELKNIFAQRLNTKFAADWKEQLKRQVEKEIRGAVAAEMRPALREEVEKEMRPKVLDKVRKELQESIPKELEPKIKAEVRPQIRIEVEAEIGGRLREEARGAIKREEASRAATPRERRAFRDFVREVEVDCLTNAHAASSTADNEERSWKLANVFRRPLFLTLLLGGAPGAFWTYQHFAGNFIALAVMVLPWLIATIGLGVSNSDCHARAENAIRGQRKIASDYWTVAERAKRLRMVDAEMATSRGALEHGLEALASAKDQIDERFMPSASRLDESRQKVRDQLIGDSNTEQLLRVEPSSPDEEEPVVEERTSEPSSNRR